LLYNSPVQNESALILLRARLSAITQRLGFPEGKREKMLLVASELVSNQVKHADGRGLIQVWQQPGPVLDIFALDYGPGIDDFVEARRDGYSTTNTLGKGLGSIDRLSDELFAYTRCDNADEGRKWSGTALLARFSLAGRRNLGREDGAALSGYSAPGLEIGLFTRSLADERFNGDRIYMHTSGETQRWLHLDGLGHGEEAQAATDNLAAHLTECDTLSEVIEAVDEQLARTRGAVAIVGEIDMMRNRLRLLGVGDMHAHVFDRKQVEGVSFPEGILGREHRSPARFDADFGRGHVVVTASDGIRRNWNLANFPGLFSQHPQLIAYLLGNIMGRISDDQSICVTTIG